MSEDRLLDGRVILLQPRDGYRVAVDPVLLAASVDSGVDRVLDVGAGTGAASLCLARRVERVQVTGIELQPDLARLFDASIARNGMRDRVRAVEGDLFEPDEALKRTSYACVISNPPFLDPRRARPATRSSVTRAHVEEAGLAAWVSACARRVEPMGWLHMVHRSDRLDELVAALLAVAGDITIFPIWPRGDGSPASRVIVRGRKGGRGAARLLPGLVLHGADGRFTPAAEQVLRRMVGLPI